MSIPVVMTVIGPDRPGLVDLIAGIIEEHGGSWQESRMAHLGGQFAGIVRAQVPEEQEQALARAMEEIDAVTLRVLIQRDQDGVEKRASGMATLEVVGHDRAGIVRQITHVLALHGVNVEELSTECSNAPMSAEMMFRAEAKLLVPPYCNLVHLQNDLERLATDLMVDLSYEPSAVPT